MQSVPGFSGIPLSVEDRQGIGSDVIIRRTESAFYMKECKANGHLGGVADLKQARTIFLSWGGGGGNVQGSGQTVLDKLTEGRNGQGQDCGIQGS